MKICNFGIKCHSTKRKINWTLHQDLAYMTAVLCLNTLPSIGMRWYDITTCYDVASGEKFTTTLEKTTLTTTVSKGVLSYRRTKIENNLQTESKQAFKKTSNNISQVINKISLYIVITF